jgi:hypothetical protein
VLLLVDMWHVMNSSYFLDCLDLELLFSLYSIPRHHQIDLPKNMMDDEKTRLKVTHLNLEGKTPHSPTSDWILDSLVEDEDLDETYFH